MSTKAMRLRRTPACGLSKYRSSRTLPELFLPHQAMQSGDTLLDRGQFGGCTGICTPLRMTFFERVKCIFNPSNQFGGIRFGQGQLVGFPPEMRHTSHRVPLIRRRGTRISRASGRTELTQQSLDGYTLCQQRGIASNFIFDESTFVMYFLLNAGAEFGGTQTWRTLEVRIKSAGDLRNRALALPHCWV